MLVRVFSPPSVLEGFPIASSIRADSPFAFGVSSTESSSFVEVTPRASWSMYHERGLIDLLGGKLELGSFIRRGVIVALVALSSPLF